MPEEAWWREVFWSQRLGRGEPLLVVPVPGVVQIAQGFDGPLSHFGKFRHALDLQRPPQQSPTDAAASIWEAPVKAPAPGVVERVRADVPDNPLGVCNYADNWGNFVCIRLDQGGYALLAHLQQSTIAVSPGARVEIGTHLAAVGNSGRSPVPHLHLQVQKTAELGAPTLPFLLANYYSGTVQPLPDWNAAAVPKMGTLILAGAPVPAVHTLLSSLAPGSAIWTAERHGEVPRSFRQGDTDTSFPVEIRLDELGRHRLHCRDSGNLVLGLDVDAWRIVEQRGRAAFLKLLALVAPSIPYAVRTGVSWSDMVPIMPDGLKRWTELPLAPYRTRPFLYAHSTCVKEPSVDSNTLRIETVVGPRHRSLPTKIGCEFELLRGPVRLDATFENGRVQYSLVSFDPRSPYLPER